MKTKRMPADYGSIEDRRREQKVTQGYKEDPEQVRARLDISRHMDDRMKGKSDRQMDPMTQMRQEIGKRMKKAK